MKKIKKKFHKIFFSLKSFFLKVFLNWLLAGIFSLFLSVFLFLSIFGKGGILNEIAFNLIFKIFGEGIVFLSLGLFFLGVCLIFSPYKKRGIYASFAFLLFFLSAVGFLGGGFVGKNLSFFFEKLFGRILTKLVFTSLSLFGLFIFYSLLKRKKEEALPKPSLIKRFFIPAFKERELLSQVPKKELKIKEIKEEEEEKGILKVEYQAPPFDLLEAEKGSPLPGDIKENCLIIKKTLENFGINVEMGEVFVGPTVTQYTLRPAEGIKLSRITSLANDLALALASHPIRIEAPIPGKSLVGIEVPNKKRTLVRLRDLVLLEKFQKAPPLCFIVGRDVSGNPVFADLAKMPHLLVAGATGTGKTIFLNSLILSLVSRNSPRILKFVLIDPKRVEFRIYQELPHLIAPVIFDLEKVIPVLDWLVSEMERRFEDLARENARDIFSFNQKAISEKRSLMPYIVLVVDELADIMALKGREVENRVVRLAQLARAVGIHLVLATQRPSVEVLTGLIKANITSRIAFQVASQFDSRTILDLAGAERLLGRGDMLFLSPENPKPKRIQGIFVSEKEIKRVVDWFREKGIKPAFDAELLMTLKMIEEEKAEREFFVEDDPLYEDAKKIIIQAKKASASLLQRRLKIGYARAARLIDLLEKRGIVGPSRGSKPREVLVQGDEEWKKV